MTAKYRDLFTVKRVFRYLLILIFVIGSAQFLPGLISGGNNQVSAASDPVIGVAGDIACDPLNSNFNNGNGTSANCRQKATSNLLVNTGLAAVLALGDNQYYCGSLQAFQQSYDLSWGLVKSITHPVVGNHEYLTNGGSSPATGCDTSNSGASGYFQYYGSAAGTAGQGYYSFDVGTWHLIALNSNCGNAGGCSTSSPQYKWLQTDLNAHPNQCTLAFWHIPLFSSGGRAASNTQSFWNLLYAHHADVVLNGHDHIYERFALQNPTAVADPNGIREFIVGTGGADHTTIVTTAANSEVRNAATYGIIRMTLHPSSYDWQFVPEAGKTFTDSGTTACHTSGAPTATPTSTLAATNTFTSTPAVSSTPTNTPTITATGSLAPTNTFTPTGSLVATNTFTPTASPTSTGSQQMVFNPVADSYVDAANPTVNFGVLNSLRVDGSPIVNTYLRFTVTGVSGTISHASLTMFANSSGSQGIRANAVADTTWGETTITSNNAPPMGSLLATSAPFSAGVRTTLDVTGYITGNGTFSIGITDPTATAISMASRESGANAPQLILSLSGGGSTPTNTFTTTQTSTPTNTPLVTNTPTPTPTNTPLVTNTPTLTATPSNTPTITDTPVNTNTPTNTPVVTNTPTRTSTPTNTPLNTNTPTNTPTITNTPVNTNTPTATSSGGQSFTFNPVADAYVDASNPTVNNGTGTTIRLDGSPIVNSYIKFNVSGLVGTVTRVRLLIHANSAGSLGIKANSVSDTSWGETTINFNNAPSMGSVLATSAAFASGATVTLDVTGYITADGTFSFGITDPSATAISLASREAGANAEQLIIDTQ